MWEDDYPLLAIDSDITDASTAINSAINRIEAGIPEDEPEMTYWRAYPQAFTLYRLLLTARDMLKDPYTERYKQDLECERARESDDEDRADARSY